MSQHKKKLNNSQTPVHGLCMTIHKLFSTIVHENLGVTHAITHDLDIFMGNSDKAINTHACLVHVRSIIRH